MTKVSVVVPVYNGEKYVEKCINRLLEEKEFLKEIVVVNDGSKDGTKEILEGYKNEKKVVVVSQENKGVSAARNSGIKACSGDWIVFCDVDDEIRPGYFQDINSTIDENSETELVCFARGFVGDADKGAGEPGFDKRKAVILSLGHPIGKYLDEYIFMSVWSKVFRKDIILNNGIVFNEKISYAEDVLFLLEYLICCGRIDLIHRGYYVYLPNEEGACKHGGSIKDYEGFFEFIDRFWDIMKKDDSLNGDRKIERISEEYLLNFGKILCGRVVRGTKGYSLKKRAGMVKDICKRMKSFYEGAPAKEKLALWFKKNLTVFYIMANGR